VRTVEKKRFGLWYDFRNPSHWHRSSDRLYREIFDQIAWGEDNGFDDIWLSEHHFIEDGYPPSILPVASAIAVRTNRIRIVSGVLLVPFHNPIRLVEDIATVDVISGGRFELGAGVGFKREEFAGFGVPFKERVARTNQSLDIIRRALAGEMVTLKSEFFEFQNVKVTPDPVQKPHPPIWLGGFTPAALRRAVRFGDGFTVPEANRDVYDRYVAALQEENRPTDHIRFASRFWCLIVSDDPEKTFAEAADHIIYQANNYSEWLSAAGLQPLSLDLRDREQLRQSGLLRVVDPDTAIRMIRNFSDDVPITHFYSWTLPPGLPRGGHKRIWSCWPQRSSLRSAESSMPRPPDPKHSPVSR
jgi:alkanesulfonate monooxygenase SsuD/methylene tetrahydromethanopterin reductase-like flavin-dependent oxidoreductase (luciferase family)